MRKTCTKCGVAKPIDQFVKNKSCKNGRAGTCRQCQNIRCTAWKRKNSVRLAAARRKRYAETKGKEVKDRERLRRERAPLRTQCQRLRAGMASRSRLKAVPFDSAGFTVDYLMDRIIANPFCECCGCSLRIGSAHGRTVDTSITIDRIRPERGYTMSNVAILCWRCNNLKRDANPKELKVLYNWLRSAWGNETI